MAYDNPYFIIDVETGGLPSSLKKKATHEIALTEVAVTVVDNVTLTIKESAGWVIKPYSDDLIYTAEAANVSGIDRSFAEQNGVDIKQAFKEFLALFKKYNKGKKKAYFVGQNSGFDTDFMNGFFELNGKTFDEFFHSDIKDTMILSRDKWPNESKHNLRVITERFEIPYVEAHRAVTDTEMTAKVFIEFMLLLRGEKQSKTNGKEETKTRVRPRYEF